MYIAALTGFPAFLRADPRAAWIALLAFAPLFGVVAVYREWWGGFAPPPRYLVPLVPLLALGLAFAIREAVARGRLARVLAAIGVSGIVGLYAAVFPATQYRHAHPLRGVLVGIDWPRYLPSFVFPDGRTAALTMVALVLAGLWGWGTVPLAGRWSPATRLTLGAGGVLVVVAAVVVVGDTLSGTREPHLTAAAANRELAAFLRRVDPARLPAGTLRFRSRERLPVDVIGLVYEPSALTGPGQDAVDDALAVGGVARRGARVGGTLVSGPPARLPRGGYRAVFHVRGEPGAAAGPVAVLGVTAAHGRLALGAREVQAGDLDPNAYRPIAFDFSLDAETAGVECRMRILRGSAIRIDRVTVSPLALRAAVRPAS